MRNILFNIIALLKKIEQTAPFSSDGLNQIIVHARQLWKNWEVVTE